MLIHFFKRFWCNINRFKITQEIAKIALLKDNLTTFYKNNSEKKKNVMKNDLFFPLMHISEKLF